MTPREVRATTLGEFNAMSTGYARANGVEDKPRMDKERLEELMERYPDDRHQ